MKKITLLLLLANAALAGQARALEILPGVEKNVLIHLGARSLDHEGWAPLDNPAALGVELDFKPVSWPVSFLVGFMVAADKREEVVISQGVPISADFESASSELDAGIRKYFHLAPGVIIYLDAGLCVFATDVIVGSRWTGSQTSSDGSAGFFFGGGGHLRLGMFGVGMNARIMNGGKLTIYGEPLKPDYFQATLVFGWSY